MAQAAAILLAGFLLICSSPSLTSSQTTTCSSQKFSDNRVYSRCSDLPVLNAFLHWTFYPDNSTLSIAFLAPPDKPDGWIAWAINPTGSGMIGAQTLFALKDSKGKMAVKPYDISGYGSVKESSKLWFDMKDSAAESSDGLMRLFATVVLPEKGKTTLNHVWQVGASAVDGVPSKHGFEPANLDSKGTLDLLSGESKSSPSADSRLQRKNIHAVLNVLSWGILFSIGILFARLRKIESMDPAWFYLHVGCQCCAYILGVAGWATGLKLGSESVGITYYTHRNIGIALFCFATLQMFALLLRPNKDHKNRKYWNIYHHGVGYLIFILSVVNIFKGFGILHAEAKWRRGYVGVTAVIVIINIWVEVLISRRKKSTPNPYNG